MKIVAAYLLAVLGGNASPDAAAIKKILSSVGADADGGQVDKLIGELKGKNLNEIIEAGKSKLSAVPSGGAAPAAAAAASTAAEPADKGGKKEEKKAEKKEEKKVEKPPSEEDLGFGLFD